MNNPDIVERLQALGARLALEGRVVSMADCHEAAAEITRLGAEAEALRKDAELYRSLREIYSGLFCGMHGMSPYVVFNKPLIQPMYFKPDMLEAAIAATKEQQA